MPLNSYNYGIKRLSLTDHLSNKNVLDTSIERIDPLRKLRGALMTLRSRPEESTFGPDEERFPNLPPQAPTVGPVREELVPSTEFGPIREAVGAISSMPQTKIATPQTVPAETQEGVIPGQPQYPGSMAAVNIPSEKGFGPKPSTTPTADYWSKPALGKMPLDQFVTLAGSLASAIAPNTPQGRAGAALAQTAGPMYRERIRREYEAPERELEMDIKREQLRKLKAPELPKVPTAWEAFYTENKDKMSSGELISSFNKLKESGVDPSAWSLQVMKNEQTGEHEKGWLQKGTTKFVSLGKASPAEIKKAEGEISAKEWAPDIQIWRNPKTNENMSLDVRNPDAIKIAKQEGFSPVGPKAKGYLTEEGKLGAKRADEIVSASAKARANIVTLESMDKLLDRFESGKLAGWGKSIQQWSSAFGIPIDTTNLSAKEAFNAMAEQLALQSRNMGEGMVLAGQMSDRDVQFLRDMNPQLVISKSGNRLIIKLRKTIAKRNNEIANLAKEYRDKNNGVFDPLGFNEYASRQLSVSSIFGIPEGATMAGTDRESGLPVYEVNGKYYLPNF